jgi:hypothetical protein
MGLPRAANRRLVQIHRILCGSLRTSAILCNGSMPDRRLDRHAREDEHAMHPSVIAVSEAARMADTENRLALGGPGNNVRREAEGRGGGGRALEQFEDTDSVALVIAAQQRQETALRRLQPVQLLTELSKLEKPVGQVAAPLVGRTVLSQDVAVERALDICRG